MLWAFVICSVILKIWTNPWCPDNRISIYSFDPIFSVVYMITSWYCSNPTRCCSISLSLLCIYRILEKVLTSSNNKGHLNPERHFLKEAYLKHDLMWRKLTVKQGFLVKVKRYKIKAISLDIFTVSQKSSLEDIENENYSKFFAFQYSDLKLKTLNSDLKLLQINIFQQGGENKLLESIVYWIFSQWYSLFL